MFACSDILYVLLAFPQVLRNAQGELWICMHCTCLHPYIFLVDRILFKEEKGCRDLVISIIDAIRQTETNGNEERIK